MEPRKKTSVVTKKQNLPPDSLKLIKEVIEKNFKVFSKDKKTVILGDIYFEEIVVLIGFQNKTGIKQVNFIASVDHDVKKKNTMSQLYISIDALGSMILQYVEADGEIELPTEWTEFALEGQKVFMKFDTTNTDLESKANKILDPKK